MDVMPFLSNPQMAPCATANCYLSIERSLKGLRLMAVRIRLARHGRQHRPFYRIVATDSRCQRDGKQLQVLGYYNPLAGDDDPKRIGLKPERVKYWLSVGAQPSDPVRGILLRAGLLSTPSMVMANKGEPGDTGPIDPIPEQDNVSNPEEPITV